MSDIIQDRIDQVKENESFCEVYNTDFSYLAEEVSKLIKDTDNRKVVDIKLSKRFNIYAAVVIYEVVK